MSLLPLYITLIFESLYYFILITEGLSSIHMHTEYSFNSGRETVQNKIYDSIFWFTVGFR